MKMESLDRQVQTSNIAQLTTAKIAVNRTAFEVLSSNIYTDKPRAIIRELSCNAYDSHIAARQTRPFQVLLPSPLSPTLVIEDFGLGIPHDKVLGIYLTYFDSDKRETDDFIGGFGLGTKSPLSYTDAFIVTSIYEGQQSVYSVHKDSEGIPTISLIHTEATHAPNGFKVEIPVSTNDFYTFQTAAEATLQYFPKDAYLLIGGQVDPVEYTIRRKNYGVLSRAAYRSIPKAIIGPVAYEIDFNPLNSADENFDLDVYHCPLDLYFDIGDVNVSVSRERLSYDSKTIKTLLAAFNKAFEDMADYICEKLSAYNTKVEQVFGYCTLTSELPQALSVKIRERLAHLEIVNNRLQVDKALFGVVNYSHRRKNSKFYMGDITSALIIDSAWVRNGVAGVAFVAFKQEGSRRFPLQRLLESNPELEQRLGKLRLVVFYYQEDAQYEAMCKLATNVVKLEDLLLAERVTSRSTKRSSKKLPPQLLVFKLGGFVPLDDFLLHLTPQATAYISLYRGKFTDSDFEELAVPLGLAFHSPDFYSDNFTLLGVPASNKTAIKELEEMGIKHLKEYYEAQCTPEYLKDIEKRLRACEHAQMISERVKDNYFRFIAECIPRNTKLYSFVKRFRRMADGSFAVLRKHRNFYDTYSKLFPLRQSTTPNSPFLRRLETVTTRYPLLPHIRHWNAKDAIQALDHYIHLIEGDSNHE